MMVVGLEALGIKKEARGMKTATMMNNAMIAPVTMKKA